MLNIVVRCLARRFYVMAPKSKRQKNGFVNGQCAAHVQRARALGAVSVHVETNETDEMHDGVDVRSALDILELESILELALEAHSNVAQPYCAMHTPCYHHAS